MGRGRAKAKQTKVARDLKYRPMNTDFDSLARELRGVTVDDDMEDEIPDAYADLAAQYEDSELDEDDADDDERRSS